MTEVAPPDVKRRRLSTYYGYPQGVTCLNDLPSGILAHAASFLAAPSRALFAIALNENSGVMPNERSSAIVGNHWETLDFGQIENDLAVELSDLDIERVLQCIDAVNKLKRLKLTHCSKITGTCLEPLRGSVVIEQIDLSLVGYNTHQPNLDPKPPISCQHVLPILDSVIEREGCALMHLQFPRVWRTFPYEYTDFHVFIVRYNQMYRNRGNLHCLECNRGLPDPSSTGWIETATVRADDYYGTQLHTCYGCLKHYCYDCNIDGQEEHIILQVCDTCQRDYCKGCSDMTSCGICEMDICNDCCKYECVQCDKKFCSKCAQDRKFTHKCECCDKCYCRECYDNEEGDIIYTLCSRCDVKCCQECRLQRYRQGHLQCTQCIKESVVMDESLALKQLREKYDELKVEAEELKRENKDLKRENEELKLENEELRSGDIE